MSQQKLPLVGDAARLSELTDLITANIYLVLTSFQTLFKVLYVLNESIVQRLKDLSKYFPHDYWLGKWNKSQKEGTRYNTHFQ